MTDTYNKRISHPTDAHKDDFFSDAPLVGTADETRFVVFFTSSQSAEHLASFLGNDCQEIEFFSDPSANGGAGRSGTFVRFVAESRTIGAVRAFVGELE